VEVAIEGEAELPVDVKVALYRITQEAFNNIAKHATATQVDVTLRRGLDQAILTIQDNGRGFDPGSVPAGHMGLNIMRERAQAIGAELTIESSPARGTQIGVIWPADDRRQTTDD
jgi:signal transduction histidine kinase